MLVSVENTNAQTYITSPGAMPGGGGWKNSRGNNITLTGGDAL